MSNIMSNINYKSYLKNKRPFHIINNKGEEEIYDGVTYKIRRPNGTNETYNADSDKSDDINVTAINADINVNDIDANFDWINSAKYIGLLTLFILIVRLIL